ncbi:hypothetical protein E3N88_33385 [Mikania micrantha]|uniref:Uncharacterized protein n=1 Tax=Mikania micrantha TaxID=192012 RepID=A0A5N6MBC2_9ASTR|nr:hypothetical protein E3N88_33385 [Mikania micrantha]
MFLCVFRQFPLHCVDQTAKDTWDKRYSKLQELIAGGAARAFAKTVVALLERIKILLQTRIQGFYSLEVYQSLKKLLKHEGLPGFYKYGSAVAVVLGCGVVVIGVDKLTVVLGGGWWQWLVGGDICDGVGWQQDVAVAECTVAGEGDGWVVMGWLLMEGGEAVKTDYIKDFWELTYPSTEMGLCKIPVNPVEDVKCTALNPLEGHLPNAKAGYQGFEEPISKEDRLQNQLNGRCGGDQRPNATGRTKQQPIIPVSDANFIQLSNLVTQNKGYFESPWYLGSDRTWNQSGPEERQCSHSIPVPIPAQRPDPADSKLRTCQRHLGVDQDEELGSRTRNGGKAAITEGRVRCGQNERRIAIIRAFDSTMPPHAINNRQRACDKHHLHHRVIQGDEDGEQVQIARKENDDVQLLRLE